MKMRYVLMLLVLAGIVNAGGGLFGGGDTSASGISTAISQKSNCKIIYPGDNPETAYDQLIASTTMGTLSATNRRVLLLMPGVYTITAATWSIDTDYVDICGGGTNREAVIVTSAGGFATITQKCNAVNIDSLTIRNTGTNTTTDFDLNVACTTGTNANSNYRNLRFYTPKEGNTGAGGAYSCYFTSGNYGTVRDCITEHYGFRVYAGTVCGGTFERCVAGNLSFGGDEVGATMTGRFIDCVGANSCFGACTTFGIASTSSSYYLRCIGGDASFSTGKEFAGTAIDCIGGYYSFAGYDGSSTTYYGTFSGTAINCTAAGGYSFGMGAASCVQSGVFIDCANGYNLLAQGDNYSSISTITDAGAKATVTLASDADNDDYKITAKTNGVWANGINVLTTTGPGSGFTSVSIALWNSLLPGMGVSYAEQWSPMKIVIRHGGTATVNTIIAGLNASTIFNRYFVAELVAGNDGSSVPDVKDVFMAGGVNSVKFMNNKENTISITASRTIYPFDSGSTISNLNATGSVTVTLPSPLLGLKYKFVVAAAQALIIEPGTAAIQKNLATATSGAGDYITSSTAGDWISIECINGTSWTCMGASQAWTEE